MCLEKEDFMQTLDKQTLETRLCTLCGKELAQCSAHELYGALLNLTQSMAGERVSSDGKKKLYYISAEFLIGKLLSNNLINLGIYDQVKELLAAHGKSLSEIEEIEPEPSLGNGWLPAFWIPLPPWA